MGDIREQPHTHYPDIIPNPFNPKSHKLIPNLDQNEAERLHPVIASNDLNNNSGVMQGVVETEEERIAKLVAMDIILWAAGSASSTCGKYENSMRCEVDKFMRRSEIPFRVLHSKLDIDETNVCELYRTISDEMLSVGDMNRGRLVGLYSLAAELSKHFVQRGLTQHLDKLASCVGAYVATRYSTWIENNGGWDGVVDFFSDDHRIEKGLWKGLLATAAIGVGALATMVLVK